MPIKKKKISELTLADSMVGLYTIGVKMVNGVQTSVKVSLEFIKLQQQRRPMTQQRRLMIPEPK